MKDLLSCANPDVVILQETRLNSMNRLMVKSVWSSRQIGWIALDAVFCGGILVMWKESSVQVFDSMVGLFSVSLACKFNGSTEAWVSGVYGPCKTPERKHFWQELYALAGLCHDVWCLVGDFNVVRWLSERQNGTHITKNMRKFNQFVMSFDLLDPPMANGLFTWLRMGDRPAASRIDRFIISKAWADSFKNFRVDRLHRPTSDHFPLALTVGALKWGPTPFRFENVWPETPNFKKKIESWWNDQNPSGWAGYRFMEKLRGLKAQIVQWNKEEFSKERDKKKDLLLQIAHIDDLEELGMISHQEIEDRNILKSALLNLIVKEQRVLRQKCKIK